MEEEKHHFVSWLAQGKPEAGKPLWTGQLREVEGSNKLEGEQGSSG